MVEKELFCWDETFPSLTLKGEGARAFLHGQTTTDIISEQKGKIFRSCWLSTKGNLKALLEIRLGDEIAEVIVLCGDINVIKDGFESVIFPSDKVHIKEINEYRRVQLISENNSWKNINVNWFKTKEKYALEINEYKKISFHDLEVWKIRQGFLSFNREINGETNPFELGLSDFVNLDKGCYLGQESIARISRSKSSRNQLRFWEASGDPEDFKNGNSFKNINNASERKAALITSSVQVKKNYYNGLALIRDHSLHKDHLFSMNGNYVKFRKPISFNDP